MTMTTRIFDGRKVAMRRRAKGWSQLQFSTLSGISIDMVREYEQGKSLPSVPRLFILADTLGCTVEDLTSES